MEEIFVELKNMVYDRIDLGVDIQDNMLYEIIDDCIFLMSRNYIISVRNKEKLRERVFNSIKKLDILQELLDDDSITEIMVNGCEIYIERNGRIECFEKRFESIKKVEDIAQKIAALSNKTVNDANPIVDTRLEDGSRVSIVLGTVALNGPIITIRKFYDKPLTMDRLIEIGSISKEAAEWLKQCVEAGYNIIISGGTGSGKTTFLNALSNYIPKDERVITIEDSAELQLRNINNLVRLEARSANTEGKNAVTIRDLIRASLRMRPDRIIVGEVRGNEAIDMLQAMNTGHDGSLSTGHSNSSRDMIMRLETMVLMGIDMPVIAIRQQIASAIDIIVQLRRMRDKSRKVVEISEVGGVKDGCVEIFPLYRFIEKETGNKDVVIGSLEKQRDLNAASKLKAYGLS